MADVRTPISPEQLEMAEKIANSMAHGTHQEQMIRNLIIDLVTEVRSGRDVWKLATEVYVGFRRQLLDAASGNTGADSLMIVCRSCRSTPAGCNASGCGGRREVDWRGQLPADAAAAESASLPALGASELSVLDAPAWVSLKAFERAERALEQYDIPTPPIVVEIMTTLRVLIEKTTAATERPF